VEAAVNRRTAVLSLASSALASGRRSQADAADAPCASPVASEPLAFTREPDGGVIVFSGSDPQKAMLTIKRVPENNPYVSFQIGYGGTGSFAFSIFDTKGILTTHLTGEKPTATSAGVPFEKTGDYTVVMVADGPLAVIIQ
jgi:hypothetical protein